MGLIYQEQLEIKTYEVDKNGYLTIPMLVHLLLHVSNKQSQHVDPQHHLAKNDMTWFILQHDLHIYRLPRANDMVIIETEALAYNKFFTYRRFKMTLDNVVLVETVMKFAVVDLKSRKLVRLTPERVSIYQAEYVSVPQKLTKVEQLDETQAECVNYIIRYTDIDSNQHVNNAIYLEWIWNSLPTEYHTKHPEKIAIIYENEVKEGTVQHGYRVVGEQTQHLIKLGDTHLARAIVTWK